MDRLRKSILLSLVCGAFLTLMTGVIMYQSGQIGYGYPLAWGVRNTGMIGPDYKPARELLGIYLFAVDTAFWGFFSFIGIYLLKKPSKTA